MTFLELLQKLEAHLGSHQMPLNTAAKNLKDIFETIPLHNELMKRLVQSIYAGNRCRHIGDPVERAATFEALAPLRLEVLRSERTDVDLYRLIEELCVALDSAFDPLPRAAGIEHLKPAGAGQVVELASFRRRRLKSRA
jgi:hypothetical protein